MHGDSSYTQIAGTSDLDDQPILQYARQDVEYYFELVVFKVMLWQIIDRMDIGIESQHSLGRQYTLSCSKEWVYGSGNDLRIYVLATQAIDGRENRGIEWSESDKSTGRRGKL